MSIPMRIRYQTDLCQYLLLQPQASVNETAGQWVAVNEVLRLAVCEP